MCGAPAQTPTLPAGIDLEKETVIYGVVRNGDAAVPGAYVRLLDSTGEFTAEVVTSATGDYRFFAAPGQWTLSVLHRDGSRSARTSTRSSPVSWSPRSSSSNPHASREWCDIPPVARNIAPLASFLTTRGRAAA